MSKLKNQLSALKRQKGQSKREFEAQQSGKVLNYKTGEMTPKPVARVAQTYASRVSGVQQDSATAKQPMYGPTRADLKPVNINQSFQSGGLSMGVPPKTQDQSLMQKISGGINKVASFLGNTVGKNLLQAPESLKWVASSPKNLQNFGSEFLSGKSTEELSTLENQARQEQTDYFKKTGKINSNAGEASKELGGTQFNVVSSVLGGGGNKITKDILSSGEKTISSWIAGKVQKGAEKEIAAKISDAFKIGGVKEAQKIFSTSVSNIPIPKIKTPIQTKPLQEGVKKEGLLATAKKEKATPVYRAGTALDKTKVTDRGISVATGTKGAGKFDYGRGINKEQISATAKIAKFEEIPKDLLVQGKNGLWSPKTYGKGAEGEIGIVKWAKDNNYDAVDLRKFGENEIRVVNPAVLEKVPKKEGLLVKAKREQQALESSKKALELEKPTQEVSKKIAKDPQVFHKDISYLKDISKKQESQLFINTDNLDISSEGKAFVKKTIEEARPMMEESVGKTLTNKEVIKLADATSDTLNRTIGREQTKNFEAALLNTRRKLATMAENGTVDKEYIETLKTVKTFSTDIARKLQSFSVKAGTTDLSKQQMIEAVLKVNDNVDEILEAAKGIDFTNYNQATEFYRKFIKPTTGEWIDMLRYNSMLSSPSTHIINTFSNAVNTSLVAPVEKTLTGTLDFVGGVFGKQRQAFAGEGGAYLKGYVKSLGEASSRFAGALSGKRAMTNLDLKFVPVATKGFKGGVTKVLSVPTRLLEASDQFFTALTEAGETAALNLRQAKGVKVPLLQLQAQQKAAYRVFRQDLFDKNQGHLLDAIDQFTSKIMSLRNNKNPIVSNVSKFTVPFIKTPMNIFKQGLEYSPAGFSTAFGSKNKMEQVSKAIIGSTVFAGAATMLSSGRLTWGEPISAKQKQEFRQAGMQPYSVKIGNKWYSYQKLVPAVAFPMAMVAAIDDLQKSKKLDDTTTEMILGGIAKYGQFLADQSYVKSIGDTLSAAKGGESGISNLVSNYPQQLIPFRALGGWLAKLTDDVQRQADNKAAFIDKQVQLLMMNIPWASTKVPARLDITGNPITNKNNILNSFSPIRVSTENSSFKDMYEKGILDRKKAAEHQSNLDKAKQKTLETGETQQVDGTFTYLDNGEVKTTTSASSIKGKEIYQEIKSLQDAGKTNEAFDKIDSLSKEDKASYNDAKAYYKQQDPNYKPQEKPVNPQQESFNKIQEYRKSGDEAGVKKIIDTMSDSEYDNYIKLRTSYRTTNTTTFKERLKSDTPEQGIRYINTLPKDEKKRIIDNMTDEEYDHYQEIKSLIK